ncbi:MAG TPA: alpha/beta hydrolase-fold protein [Tepidisphaeraceae bacterium]|nr:alpha/beta hydrolase-fold protein [Tepidisphaeraceae bacterium]
MNQRNTLFAFAFLTFFTFTLQAADAPKKPDPNAQYVLGPDSKPQEGVPKGVVTKYEWKESKNFPGTIHDYWVYVPAQYDGKTPACVYVSQDGIQYNAPVVFDNLIAKKQMPVTIGIFINPGYFPAKEGEPAKKPDGKPNTRSNRSVEYDSLGDTYSKFLLDEIMPEVAKKYKLTDNPEGRCIAGASSGGICAFTVAWERPDQFRKVFSSIGSFTNIRGGNVYPDLVRKADKKPIRVFQQDGSNDIVNKAGSWPEANKAMNAALEEKGYDHKFVVGEGTHNGRHAAAIFPDVMRWMWRDWPGVEKQARAMDAK